MSAPPAALGNTPAAPANPAARTADDFADYDRDQWGRPLIVQLDDAGQVIYVQSKEGPVPLRTAYTRASRAGSALEYQGALNSYHIRNACIGLVVREDLYFLAKSVHEPGGAGRREFDKSIVKPAQEAAGASGAANMGTALHSFAEKSDRGELVPQLGPYQGSLDAYRSLTTGWRWVGIECRLISDRFRMAGKADRLGSPPGFMVAPDGAIITPDDVLVIDLKTSSSDRYFGVKFAVQLCVYAYGEFYDLATFARTPTGARTDWALVVHVPTGGSSGALYWVDLKRGVELVALAREVLDAQGERDLVTQVGATAIYATLEEAQAFSSALLAGNSTGVTVPSPEPSAEENDPEPSTATPAERQFAERMAWEAQLAADPAAGTPVGYSCEIHKTYGVGACPECALEVAATAEVTGESELAVEARLAGEPSEGPAPGPGDDPDVPADRPYMAGKPNIVPASVTDSIHPNLGRYLQMAASDAAVPQLERELNVIRSAGITSSLASVRDKGWTWTAEHETACALREWELTIITAIESATSEDQLMATALQVQGWDRWTDEMRRLARRQSAILRAREVDGT